jgi:hypothetical protein
MDTDVQEKVTRRRIGPAVAVGVATVGAWMAIVYGLATAVMGWSAVQVPVGLGPDAPASSTQVVPCFAGWPADGSAGCGPAAAADEWPGGEPLPVRHVDGPVAEVTDAGTLTALLATVPGWGGLVAAGAVVLVLVPVLRSTAAGDPFARGNARRLAVAAAVVVGAWVVVTVGPYVAAHDVVALVEAAPRLTETGPLREFPMPTGWLVPELRVTWWPLLPALLLAALAGATRTGTRVAADTAGLV